MIHGPISVRVGGGGGGALVQVNFCMVVAPNFQTFSFKLDVQSFTNQTKA